MTGSNRAKAAKARAIRISRPWRSTSGRIPGLAKPQGLGLTGHAMIATTMASQEIRFACGRGEGARILWLSGPGLARVTWTFKGPGGGTSQLVQEQFCDQNRCEWFNRVGGRRELRVIAAKVENAEEAAIQLASCDSEEA